jgi:hypothetical protein
MHQLPMQRQLLQMQQGLKQLQQHRRSAQLQQLHPATRSSRDSQKTITRWRMQRQQSGSALLRLLLVLLLQQY